MASNADGKVRLLNPILAQESEDHLYHFGIIRSAVDLPKLFGDVKVSWLQYFIIVSYLIL